MSNRGEMWVHGCSVVIQYPGGDGSSPFTPGHRMMYALDPARSDRRIPWSDLLGARSPAGATFRGARPTTAEGNSNWFHFSIPTPAVVPSVTNQRNMEITVDAVSVYYKTPSNQITIRAITVSDGPSGTQGIPRVAAKPLHGDHSVRSEENLNTWSITPIHIRERLPHGVLISVQVRFDIEGEITFIAAGIHYGVR